MLSPFSIDSDWVSEINVNKIIIIFIEIFPYGSDLTLFKINCFHLEFCIYCVVTLTRTFTFKWLFYCTFQWGIMKKIITALMAIKSASVFHSIIFHTWNGNLTHNNFSKNVSLYFNLYFIIVGLKSGSCAVHSKRHHHISVWERFCVCIWIMSVSVDIYSFYAVEIHNASLHKLQSYEMKRYLRMENKLTNVCVDTWFIPKNANFRHFVFVCGKCFTYGVREMKATQS